MSNNWSIPSAAKRVQGAIDKQTERAGWTIGIYNLTKDESSVLVHFGKDDVQQWLMVPLNKQSQTEGDSSPQGC